MVSRTRRAMVSRTRRAADLADEASQRRFLEARLAEVTADD